MGRFARTVAGIVNGQAEQRKKDQDTHRRKKRKLENGTDDLLGGKLYGCAKDGKDHGGGTLLGIKTSAEEEEKDTGDKPLKKGKNKWEERSGGGVGKRGIRTLALRRTDRAQASGHRGRCQKGIKQGLEPQPIEGRGYSKWG